MNDGDSYCSNCKCYVWEAGHIEPHSNDDCECQCACHAGMGCPYLLEDRVALDAGETMWYSHG